MAQWTVGAKLALLRQHDEDGVPWTRLAASTDVPARTLSRWAQQYRMQPTSVGLERRPRSDKGQQRTPQEIGEAVQALALRRPEPTVAFIHRRVSGPQPRRPPPTHHRQPNPKRPPPRQSRPTRRPSRPRPWHVPRHLLPTITGPALQVTATLSPPEPRQKALRFTPLLISRGRRPDHLCHLCDAVE